jgi:predicted kinase
MLRTRHRERLLLEACLAGKQPYVVDNTNVARAERAIYIEQAKSRGFRVVGYYLASRLAECMVRNAERGPAREVPVKGLLGTAGRLERPNRDEGFDELYYVAIDETGQFVVSDWNDEI